MCSSDLDQAAFLAMLSRRYQSGLSPLDAEPEKVVLRIPAGGMRSIGLKFQNIADAPVQASATVAAADDAPADDWIVLRPGDFAVSQGVRKTVELKVRVPVDASPGRYCSAVVVKAGPSGPAGLELKVPVEIEVTTEK
mgnify:CR=1 FL=1